MSWRKMAADRPQETKDKPRPQFLVVLGVLFALLILGGLGQWDWVLAGLIGIALGMGLWGLLGRR